MHPTVVLLAIAYAFVVSCRAIIISCTPNDRMCRTDPVGITTTASWWQCTMAGDDMFLLRDCGGGSRCYPEEPTLCYDEDDNVI
ncbi:hypothetical protein QBC39DRAFT_355277 [Podospora conica]|nr:hypothetical protein QBC39DRAFT_355277 [Schizothecium conicum]